MAHQRVTNYGKAWNGITMSGMCRVTIIAMIVAVLPQYIGEAADHSGIAAKFAEKRAEREAMVRTQFKGMFKNEITDEQVLDAMLKVPRHLFIPAANRAFAYYDTPVPIGYGQTISQPYIVAYMTKLLDVKPGMKVLEVGTGSGYQAAILAEITPHVFTIEIIEPLYKNALATLTELGYDSVTVRQGDGYYGMKDSGPFDRIIVTCAALHVPPPLFEQLKPGGKMVIPVGGQFETQRLLLISKNEDGGRTSQTLEHVRFVPLLRSGEQQK